MKLFSVFIAELVYFFWLTECAYVSVCLCVLVVCFRNLVFQCSHWFFAVCLIPLFVYLHRIWSSFFILQFSLSLPLLNLDAKMHAKRFVTTISINFGPWIRVLPHASTHTPQRKTKMPSANVRKSKIAEHNRIRMLLRKFWPWL